MSRLGRVLLGVDGGNTKSIALVATADGTIVGSGRSAGSGDIYAGPPDEAIARLEAAADEGLRRAGVGDGGIDSAVFSAAGADWPEDIELLEVALRRRWPTALVVNDGIGALRATIPAGPGVVVVCGTGAATAARGTDGTTWHSSFWQEAHGAHELGVQTLQAIVRADLGIDRPTALTRRVLDVLGEPDVEALLHRVTSRATRARREQATLAPVVLDVAEGGDPAARAIVESHGIALGRTALAAAQRVSILDHPFALALAGGVIRHSGALLPEAIVRTVLERAPGTTVAGPRFEPAVGALLLAFDQADIAVTPEVETRLRASLPPAALFDTHPAAVAAR